MEQEMEKERIERIEREREREKRMEREREGGRERERERKRGNACEPSTSYLGSGYERARCATRKHTGNMLLNAITRRAVFDPAGSPTAEYLVTLSLQYPTTITCGQFKGAERQSLAS